MVSGQVMALKGQIHIHTTLSDGTMNPQQAEEVYARLGYDFIAYCDHDHLLKPDYHQEIARVKSELIILAGIELTVATRWGYIHVSRIEGDSEDLYIFNHPADYGLSLKETRECIQEAARIYRIDLVEVSRHGFYTPEYDTEEIAYPKIATDDSHVSWACGRTWVEVTCRRDKDEIIRHLKKGAFRYGFAKGEKQTIVLA